MVKPPTEDLTKDLKPRQQNEQQALDQTSNLKKQDNLAKPASRTKSYQRFEKQNNLSKPASRTRYYQRSEQQDN